MGSEGQAAPYLSLVTIKLGLLHSHLHLNGGMRVVVADLKVLCTEIIDALHFSQDLQRGEGADLPLKLQIKDTCKL